MAAYMVTWKAGRFSTAVRKVERLTFISSLLTARNFSSSYLPPDKGLHRPDGGEALLDHRVQMVHGLLQQGVLGGDPAHHKEQHQPQHRGADKEHHCQPGLM